MSWISGILYEVGKRLLTWLIEMASAAYAAWQKKRERAQRQAEAKKIYDQVSSDIKSTAEQRAEAYANYINAGRS